jgi:cellulose synthase (UDP-forming)
MATPRRKVTNNLRADSTRSDIELLHPADLAGSRQIIDEYVLRGFNLAVYFVMSAIWFTANIMFWHWWFQPERVVTWWRFALTTFALSYDLTLMPFVLILFLYHMKRPLPMSAQPGLRVAMVTAIVPSAESIEILEQTVAGMVMGSYPHDNWVLDEGGDPRVRALCDEYGVHYWSRKGIQKFNQPTWPFQAKTKSGNYNSWFSEIGYRDYDYLVQLDTDHIPDPDYLDEVLGYFRDPEVAYVALPSVYRNLEDWTTRGSSEQSQVFQGPIQMGYYGWANSPMIIGSHAAYRMKHLQEIGGFAPSRAEDHLDSLRFVQAGYRGVFVPKVLAEGLGPHNLSDFLAQEHQWAFSIAQVLFKFGRDKGLLTLRQRIVFLFSELWYFLYAATFLILFLIPLLALLSGQPVANVPLIEFIMRSAPVTLTSLALLAWAYSRRWFKPGTHFMISWQGILLGFARWPIVLIAIAEATISVLFRQGRFTYLVTPKGGAALSVRNALRSVTPYVVLGLISAFVPIVYWRMGYDGPGHAAGYVLFALMSSVAFIAILLAATADFIRVNAKYSASMRQLLVKTLPFMSLALLLICGTALSGWLNRTQTIASITYRMTASNNSSFEAAATQPSVAAAQPPVSTVPSDPPILQQQSVAVSSWLFNPARGGVTFGAYDPTGQLNGLSGLDHLFISWEDNASGGVPVDQIDQSYANGVPVLLSVEPWPLDGRSQSTLLGDIAGGSYDTVIQNMAHTVRSLHQPILLRFGHEMDMTNLYPWAQGDPAAYIAAYRHVVDIFRADEVTNVLWVWSPGGEIDAPSYYPGDSYVDYVGTTILEYTLWETDLAHVETPRPLSELISEKYRLVEQFHKPIILAEVGVDLDPALKLQRVEEMIQALPNFPAVRAVVYFNDRNPLNTFAPDEPDWTLNSQEIETLRAVIAQSPWVEQQQNVEAEEPPELTARPH